jgi:uncharacterized tellurite resistance protein B-like protein
MMLRNAVAPWRARPRIWQGTEGRADMLNWKKIMQKNGQGGRPAPGTRTVREASVTQARLQTPAFDRIQVAMCAILLEVAEYDEEFSGVEKTTIGDILKARFDISDAEVADLMKLAARERKESHSLWPFTSYINENFSKAEKKRILEAAWEVIYADDRLSSYEDYFVHKLAKLLRLEHEDLIAAKLKVKGKKQEPA